MKDKTSKHTEYNGGCWMCVFVWHPKPCFILTFLKFNNISSIDLLYAFCAHGQDFVCTKVASKFLVSPNLYSYKLGSLVI